MKGNRQGSLSRPINTFFEAFYDVSKSAISLQKSLRTFWQTERPDAWSSVWSFAFDFYMVCLDALEEKG